MELARGRGVGSQRPHVREVLAVHRDDQVEVVEVRRSNLCALLSSAIPRAAAAAVARSSGGMADVPAAGPGALDVDDLGQARRAELVAHHALGGRRAADVAEADEEDPHQPSNLVSAALLIGR